MASWTNRTPSGSTNRRKWNLEDRASLNNLKYHFAADGCSDVQYDLAKQLLDNSADVGEEASQSEGVHWLLCAAHGGHEEALKMLSECFNSGRGITENNEMEVRECLSMTAGERAARKAARDLFACLSNGGEHITPAQLERKMREIYNIQKKRKHKTEGAGREQIQANGHVYPSPVAQRNLNLSEHNIITEANLVTAAVNYSHGQLPNLSGILMPSVPNPHTLDHVPCFHRLVFHPFLFFSLLYHRFIKVISSYPEAALSNLKLIFLFMVYAAVSSENLAVFLPMALYSFSFALMIWSTFKMLKTKHEFIDFRIWSGLFLRYGDNIDVGESENQFLRNNMKPYICFFLAFIINLMTYPVISSEWMPHSEITVVSFGLVFLTMTAFMYTSPKPFPDMLVLVSFGVNMLAKYPYEMDSVVITGWRFLDLKVPTFCSFVIGNGIEFCLNCRAVLYLLIPGFFIQLAKRSNWHGTYTYLMPHCVTLSWLQICIISSQYATMFGLVRAALGLAAVMLFLPLFGIITLMIPIFVTVEWLGLTNPNIRMVTSMVAALFALLGSCFMAINRKTQRYVTTIQVGVCILAAAFLTLPYMTSNFSASLSKTNLYDSLLHDKPLLMRDDISQTIPWDTFYKYCDYPAWQHMNKIRTQLRCSQLEGSLIKWEGAVSSVQITKVSNYRVSLIKNYLPNWMGNLILCYYSERDKFECDDDGEQCEELKKIRATTNECSPIRWNIYEYEIKVRMHSGILSRSGEVYLKASHSFGNFTRSLTVSDRIWFKGRLVNSRKVSDRDHFDMILGTGKPVVEVIAIGCSICHNKDIPAFQSAHTENLVVGARMRDLMRGIKYLLNVLFNPLLTFK